MTYVIPLENVQEMDRRAVGGKGMALSIMTRQGMNVPKTYCIHSGAYNEYISRTQLRDRIAVELGRKDFKDMRWEEIWDTSLRIRNIFLNTPIPTKLYESLSRPLKTFFHDMTVAVRSSALEEDSSKVSFAGLHESYINIRGIDSILEHIRLVWASLWSDTALLYRRELGLDVERSTMAVLILEMIAGEKSGVVFGMNPNNKKETVIESVYGLNQGMVDGTVEPDQWILDRNSGKIISHSAAQREKSVQPISGSTALLELSKHEASRPPLNDNEIEKVFHLAKQAESIFGSPQDVEWTWKGHELYALQSRAITTILSDESKDERPWYLSLHRSFDNLKMLRLRIEEDLIPAMIAEAKNMANINLSILPDNELIDEISKQLKVYKRWLKIYRDEFIPYAHGIRLFGMFYNDTLKPTDPYEFMNLLQKTEIEAVARNRMLETMAAMVRQNPELAADIRKGKVDDEAFSKVLRRFTEKYGDIAWHGGQGTQGSTPLLHIVLEMASNSLLEEKKPAGDTSELEKKFLRHFQEDKKTFAAELLDLARSSYKMRDNDNIYLGKIRGQLVRIIEAYKERCKGKGQSWQENKTVRDAMESLEEKSSTIRQSQSMNDSYAFPLKARQIVGQPSGPGIASGKARIITEHSDLFSFRKGEVLVCDAIDPTMTIVVPLAAGIVERRGGMLIHGAIIAREYGIPCVTGIPDAVEQIHTGDTVTVDGYLGIVIIG